MSTPDITSLPPSPSRIGDPENFNAEYPVFLAAQSNFQNQSNTLQSYLNNLPFNPFDWGKTTDVNPTRVQLELMNPAPSTTDTGLNMVSKADRVLSELKEYSDEFNTAGDYIDSLQSLAPSSIVVPDELRPIIPSVTTPPSQSNDQSTFNFNAFNFYQSSVTHINAVKDFVDYMYKRLNQPEDWGLSTETVTEIEDWNL